MSILSLLFSVMVLIIWGLIGFVMMLLDAITASSNRKSSVLKKVLMFPAERIAELIVNRR